MDKTTKRQVRLIVKKNVYSHQRRRPGWVRLTFLVCLIAVLPVAVCAALVGWRWQPWPPGADGYRSVLAESSGVARTLTEIVYSV